MSIYTAGREAMTNAVRAPVRPATRWMQVVSRASGRGIAGRMVVSRLISLEVRPFDEWSRKRLNQRVIKFLFDTETLMN
jgi:hypothetical protein